MMRPDFKFEKESCFHGEMVIGVDEVGRGSLAGPVVAGAVVVPQDDFWLTRGIDDSKRLTSLKREKLAKIIMEKCVWGIGDSSVNTINKKGIVKASEIAMRLAIKNLRSKTNDLNQCFLLIDAFNIKYVPSIGLKHQKAIIKGDQKSISIAAASIIAKVYRDDLMKKLHQKYLNYGWERNVGYGTKEHLVGIKKYGITRFHRTSFVHF